MIENNVIEDNTLVKGSKVFVEERDIEEFTCPYYGGTGSCISYAMMSLVHLWVMG